MKQREIATGAIVFPFEPGDRVFTDSPDVGDAKCICSRCGQIIDEPCVPIRVSDPLGVSERRYHPSCLGWGGGD